MSKITTVKTQGYLIVAAHVERDIKDLFKKIDRLRRMLGHKDAEKLPQVKADLINSCWALLGVLDERMDAYEFLITLAELETPRNWRDYA